MWHFGSEYPYLWYINVYSLDGTQEENMTRMFSSCHSIQSSDYLLAKALMASNQLSSVGKDASPSLHSLQQAPK